LSSYEEARAALGARLRQLRKDAGLTGEQLARRFGWQQSKVSRIETGKQNASEADITAWAQAVGAASEVVEELLAGLKAVQIEYATWRQQHQAGGQADQQPGNRLGPGVEAPQLRNEQPRFHHHAIHRLPSLG